MSPEKLFDYLDGTLNATEREQLEASLTHDEVLQRELAIARQIHKGMGRSREVIPDDTIAEPDPRGGILGRRVATAFAVLVGLNVVIGLLFIATKHQKNKNPLGPSEAAIRKQLQESVEKATSSAFPVWPIGMAEIALQVSAGQRDRAAAAVVAAAQRVGGTGTPGLPDEEMATVIAEIPAAREPEFRQSVALLGATTTPSAAPPAETQPAPPKKMIQVRISENAPPTSP